jgi:16S rRNA (guanine966-N2)-methyltransferase
VPRGARVLDLFAGSGALGIEALSRGAVHATFVESDAAALASLRRNLETLGLLAAVRIVRGDANRVPLEGPYDLVFADPPYERMPSAEFLERLSGLLEASGVLVLEHSARVAPAEPRVSLSVWKHRRYGGTAVTLYRHSREDAV